MMRSPRAGHTAVDPTWITPVTPFRIVGNLYYVGSEELASYLLVTSKGDILINSNLEESVPQIRHSIEQLGFRFSDVRVLLISHAHFDHAAGSAQVKRQSGARYMVMDGDVTSRSSSPAGRGISSIPGSGIPRQRSIACSTMEAG